MNVLSKPKTMKENIEKLNFITVQKVLCIKGYYQESEKATHRMIPFAFYAKGMHYPSR